MRCQLFVDNLHGGFMIKKMHLSILSLCFINFFGDFCLGLTPGYSNQVTQPTTEKPPQNISSSHPDDLNFSGNDQRFSGKQSVERQSIVDFDERDRDIYDRANRKGDWNYKQNWRYDRQDYYQGKSQAEAYEKNVNF